MATQVQTKPSRNTSYTPPQWVQDMDSEVRRQVIQFTNESIILVHNQLLKKASTSTLVQAAMGRWIPAQLIDSKSALQTMSNETLQERINAWLVDSRVIFPQRVHTALSHPFNENVVRKLATQLLIAYLWGYDGLRVCSVKQDPTSTIIAMIGATDCVTAIDLCGLEEACALYVNLNMRQGYVYTQLRHIWLADIRSGSHTRTTNQYQNKFGTFLDEHRIAGTMTPIQVNFVDILDINDINVPSDQISDESHQNDSYSEQKQDILVEMPPSKNKSESLPKTPAADPSKKKITPITCAIGSFGKRVRTKALVSGDNQPPLLEDESDIDGIAAQLNLNDELNDNMNGNSSNSTETTSAQTSQQLIGSTIKDDGIQQEIKQIEFELNDTGEFPSLYQKFYAVLRQEMRQYGVSSLDNVVTEYLLSWSCLLEDVLLGCGAAR